MHDFLHELEASPVRWTLALERRRIARLRNATYDSEDLMHEPALIPQPQSKKTRDIWKYAVTAVSEHYIYYLAYLDDFAELIRRQSAPDELFYLTRLKDRRSKLIPTPGQRQSIQIHDLLTVLAEALANSDQPLTLAAIKGLSTHLTSLCEDDTLQDALSAHLQGPLPAYNSGVSFTLESLITSIKLCKKANTGLKDRKIKAEAEAAEQIARRIIKVLHDGIGNDLAALHALQQDEHLVERVVGPATEGDFRQSILKLVGPDRARDYFTSVIEGSRQTLQSLLKIGT